MVPERVTMEIMVRAFTIDAMEDASHKVNRSMKAAAMRWGARVEIHDCIGYLPLNTDRQIARLYRDNMMAYEHAGKMRLWRTGETAGSTDPGGHFPDHALYAYLGRRHKGRSPHGELPDGRPVHRLHCASQDDGPYHH